MLWCILEVRAFVDDTKICMSWVNVEIAQENTNVETGSKIPQPNMKG